MNGNFLGSWGHQLVPKPKLRTFVRLFTLVSPGFSKVTGYLLQQHPSAVLLTLLRHPTTLLAQFRNINRISIDYGSRPRLRH